MQSTVRTVQCNGGIRTRHIADFPRCCRITATVYNVPKAEKDALFISDLGFFFQTCGKCNIFSYTHEIRKIAFFNRFEQRHSFCF